MEEHKLNWLIYWSPSNDFSSRSWHTFNEGQFQFIKCVLYCYGPFAHQKKIFFARYNNKFCLTPNFTIKCQFQLQSIDSMIKNSSKIYIP